MRKICLTLLIVSFYSTVALGQTPITIDQTSSFLDPSRSGLIDFENNKPGTSEWHLTQPAKGGELEGYAYSPTDQVPSSVNKGGLLDIRVNTVYASYKVRMFRMGNYGGSYATEIFLLESVFPGKRQIMPSPDPANFNVIVPRWDVSFTLKIPESLMECPSGLYLIQLTGLDSAGEERGQRFVPFIVRDDERPSALLVKLGFSADQAYNGWHDAIGGLGQSIYAHTSKDGKKALKVALVRPHDFDGTASLQHIIGMVAFLEKQGFDVSYTTGVDIDKQGFLIPQKNKAVLFVGHDEYWSKAERDYVESAKKLGVSLIFWGANQCYRQVRYEEYLGMPYAIMAGFKESWALDPVAKINPALATTEFSSAQVNRPEFYLIGTEFLTENQLEESNPADAIIASVADIVMQDTDVKVGEVISKIVGYEYNSTPTLSQLLSAGISNLRVIARADFPKKPPMEMTVYRAQPYGNIVFSASTINAVKLEHPWLRKLLLNVLTEASQTTSSPWKTSK